MTNNKLKQLIEKLEKHKQKMIGLKPYSKKGIDSRTLLEFILSDLCSLQSTSEEGKVGNNSFYQINNIDMTIIYDIIKDMKKFMFLSNWEYVRNILEKHLKEKATDTKEELSFFKKKIEGDKHRDIFDGRYPCSRCIEKVVLH